MMKGGEGRDVGDDRSGAAAVREGGDVESSGHVVSADGDVGNSGLVEAAAAGGVVGGVSDGDAKDGNDGVETNNNIYLSSTTSTTTHNNTTNSATINNNISTTNQHHHHALHHDNHHDNNTIITMIKHHQPFRHTLGYITRQVPPPIDICPITLISTPTHSYLSNHLHIYPIIPIKAPSQRMLPTHSLNTPYQYSLSSKLHINPPYQPTLSTHLTQESQLTLDCNHLASNLANRENRTLFALLSRQRLQGHPAPLIITPTPLLSIPRYPCLPPPPPHPPHL